MIFQSWGVASDSAWNVARSELILVIGLICGFSAIKVWQRNTAGSSGQLEGKIA
jgi:hypothetical protein